MIIGKPFKLEYQCGDSWEVVGYYDSLSSLRKEIIKWRNWDYNLRCLTQTGEDLAKGN